MPTAVHVHQTNLTTKKRKLKNPAAANVAEIRLRKQRRLALRAAKKPVATKRLRRLAVANVAAIRQPKKRKPVLTDALRPAAPVMQNLLLALKLKYRSQKWLVAQLSPKKL